jgi:hypothetical protein
MRLLQAALSLWLLGLLMAMLLSRSSAYIQRTWGYSKTPLVFLRRCLWSGVRGIVGIVCHIVRAALNWFVRLISTW